MSLGISRYRQYVYRFPRVSGDEPVSVVAETKNFRFSPRERG